MRYVRSSALSLALASVSALFLLTTGCGGPVEEQEDVSQPQVETMSKCLNDECRCGGGYDVFDRPVDPDTTFCGKIICSHHQYRMICTTTGWQFVVPLAYCDQSTP